MPLILALKATERLVVEFNGAALEIELHKLGHQRVQLAFFADPAAVKIERKERRCVTTGVPAAAAKVTRDSKPTPAAIAGEG